LFFIYGVVLAGQVVEVSTSKTGKHGHAKCHFVGIDIFTGKKLEDIVPSSHNCDVCIEYLLDLGFTFLIRPLMLYYGMIYLFCGYNRFLMSIVLTTSSSIYQRMDL